MAKSVRLRARSYASTLLLLAVLVSPAAAAEEAVELRQSESASRPAPPWVRMVNPGEKDPALQGYRAPAGVKVEVVAREPDVVNPVGMRFADDGSPLVIEWKVGRPVEGRDTP